MNIYSYFQPSPLFEKIAVEKIEELKKKFAGQPAPVKVKIVWFMFKFIISMLFIIVNGIDQNIVDCKFNV